MSDDPLLENLTNTFTPDVYPKDLAVIIQEIDRVIFEPHQCALAPLVFDEYFPQHHIPIYHFHLPPYITYSKGCHFPGTAPIETYVVWGKEIKKKAKELLERSHVSGIGDAGFKEILTRYALAIVRHRVLLYPELFPGARMRTLANVYNDPIINIDYRKKLFQRKERIPINKNEESAATTDIHIILDLVGIAMRDERQTLYETLHFLTNT